MKNIEITEVAVDSLPIRLGQFLKLANIVQDGFEAKIHIQAGMVQVNSAKETRRGCQLNLGDIISFDGQSFKITAE